MERLHTLYQRLLTEMAALLPEAENPADLLEKNTTYALLPAYEVVALLVFAVGKARVAWELFTPDQTAILHNENQSLILRAAETDARLREYVLHMAIANVALVRLATVNTTIPLQTEWGGGRLNAGLRLDLWLYDTRGQRVMDTRQPDPPVGSDLLQ